MPGPTNDKFVPALVESHRVIAVDLAARVCAGGEFSDRLGTVDDARPDGVHFSDPGADWVATWLGPLLADPGLRTEHLASVPVRRS